MHNNATATQKDKKCFFCTTYSEYEKDEAEKYAELYPKNLPFRKNMCYLNVLRVKNVLYTIKMLSHPSSDFFSKNALLLYSFNTDIILTEAELASDKISIQS